MPTAADSKRHVERGPQHRTLSGPCEKKPGGGPGRVGSFFQMLYQVLIGQERGPRFGSFVALYGIAETRALIARALMGQLT